MDLIRRLLDSLYVYEKISTRSVYMSHILPLFLSKLTCLVCFHYVCLVNSDALITLEDSVSTMIGPDKLLLATNRGDM